MWIQCDLLNLEKNSAIFARRTAIRSHPRHPCRVNGRPCNWPYVVSVGDCFCTTTEHRVGSPNRKLGVGFDILLWDGVRSPTGSSSAFDPYGSWATTRSATSFLPGLLYLIFFAHCARAHPAGATTLACAKHCPRSAVWDRPYLPARWAGPPLATMSRKAMLLALLAMWPGAHRLQCSSNTMQQPTRPRYNNPSDKRARRHDTLRSAALEVPPPGVAVMLAFDDGPRHLAARPTKLMQSPQTGFTKTLSCVTHVTVQSPYGCLRGQMSHFSVNDHSDNPTQACNHTNPSNISLHISPDLAYLYRSRWGASTTTQLPNH